MYTSNEREKTLNDFLEKLCGFEETIGVIIVGSGCFGFKDRYSDIDLCVVHREDVGVEAMFVKTHSAVSDDNNVKLVQNHYNRNLQVILLDNYLEIDIGFYTLSNLYARRSEYKVLFDKSGEIERIMDESKKSLLKENHGTTGNVDIEWELRKADGILWYQLFHCVTSFLRNDKYRCCYELEEMRRMIISLVGKRCNEESAKFRNVHCLPTVEKENIDKLFVYPQSKEELKKLLLLVVDMLYFEYEFWYKKKHTEFVPEIEKNYLTEYIECNL